MATKIHKLSQNNVVFYPATITEAVIVDGTTNLKTKLAAQDTATTKVATDLATLKTSIGKANGIAPLGGDNKIPISYLPSYVDDVEDLINFITTIPITVVDGGVYYNSTTKKLETYEVRSGTPVLVNSKNPVGDKIYININNHKTYRWSGTEMVQLDAGLVIGTTTGTAFDGARGLAVETKATNTVRDVNLLQGTVDTVEAEVQALLVFKTSTESFIEGATSDMQEHSALIEAIKTDIVGVKRDYVTAAVLGTRTYIDIPPALFP